MPFFLSAGAGVGATFFLSICGAVLAVFLGRSKASPAAGRIFSGFACGVMTAALVFSLLMPAIEMSTAQGVFSVVPALGGFRASGLGGRKAFLFTAATAAVEPLAGLLAVGALGAAQNALPWFLGFAAGAMLYAVADDFMPCSAGGQHEGTAACLLGFALMLLLDAALGG